MDKQSGTCAPTKRHVVWAVISTEIRRYRLIHFNICRPNEMLKIAQSFVPNGERFDLFAKQHVLAHLI